MNSNDLTNISNDMYKLVFHLNRIYKPAEIIKGLALPPSHIKVIFYLIHRGASSVSNVAKDLDISKPNMTPIIDKLINEGFVIRYVDPDDRRILRIEVTAQAHDLCKCLEKNTKNIILTKISSLSDEDLSTLKTSVHDLSYVVQKLLKMEY